MYKHRSLCSIREGFRETQRLYLNSCRGFFYKISKNPGFFFSILQAASGDELGIKYITIKQWKVWVYSIRKTFHRETVRLAMNSPVHNEEAS